MSVEEKIKIENLRLQYQEVCKSHTAITDFRGKLLALLPLASGTGIYLLVTKKGELIEPKFLTVVGAFGFLVTLGLFLHELRGIKQCSALIELGKSLEERLQLEGGQFTLEDEYYNVPQKFRRFAHEFVGPVGAAWIIYLAMILAWLFVAIVPLFTVNESPKS